MKKQQTLGSIVEDEYFGEDTEYFLYYNIRQQLLLFLKLLCIMYNRLKK